MSHWKAIAIAVFCCSLLTAHAFQDAAPVTGQWLIDGRPVDGRIQLTLQGNRGSSGHFSSASTLPLDQLRGLAQGK